MESSAQVAYVVGAYPVLSESFIRTEVRLLPEGGWAPRLCALTRGSSTMADPLDLEAARGACYRPSRLGCLGLSFLYGISGSASERARGAAAAHFAERLADDPPDHVHAHFLGAPTEVGYALAEMLDRSFTFACHAADVFTAERPSPLEHAAVHRAHSIVTCTEYLRRHLVEKRGYPPGKVRLIRHGVDLALIDEIPRPHGADGERPQVIGAVGRLVRKKGFHVLLEAVHPLLDEQNAELHVIGDGPERARLEQLAAGLGDRVRFLGAHPWRETLTMLAGFSVLAVPSVMTENGDMDGLPNVALEAGALGVPVVASTLSGLPELISDARSGWLVTPGKAAPLTKALRQALTQREDAAKRAARLGEQVRASWDARAASAALAGLFAEARARRGPRRSDSPRQRGEREVPAT